MASKTAQTIYDIKLKQSARNYLDRLKNQPINILFDHFKKENPLVEASIGNFKLKLPFSHELPFILKSFPYYSTNLARIAKQVYEKYSDLKFIDIGANIGDSVALLRTEADFPILCIEGDEHFFSILQTNAARFNDVYLAKNYVGESTGKFNASSIEVGGTAHLSQSEVEGNIIDVKSLSNILEGYQSFKLSKMLKVDTDGFDNKILRGSIDFLETSKPVIFFEYDPFFLSQQNDDGLSIFSTINSIGYQNILIYENDGEYLISAELDNVKLLEDITYFYTGRKGAKYCDICAFHKDDNDLFDSIRKAEINYFRNSRSL